MLYIVQEEKKGEGKRREGRERRIPWDSEDDTLWVGYWLR